MKDNKFRGKGKRNTTRRKYDKVDAKDIDTKRNDASWYTRNQALIADSGKIAFTWPTGSPVDMGFTAPNLTQHINGEDNLNFPGVMALHYVPTYGLSNNGYDPLNIAAQNIYTYVRHVNSGHANYDPNDLMLYLMAMDQIYSLYMHLVRAYGTVRLFSQKNRNFPRVVMNAQGFDYDEVANNLANFRYFINNAATRIGAMAVPNVMPLFTRHMWMPSGLYTDSPSAKAQMYLFRPYAFGTYNEKSSPNGGYLSVDFLDHKHNLGDWINQLNSMISAVRSSEDCGIMSGDILKAYGEDKVIKLPFISEDYMTTVSYSPEVLGQIANTTIMPEPVYDYVSAISDSPMIYQDMTDNVLKSALSFSAPLSSTQPVDAYYPYLGKRVMLGLSEQPTPEEVMVNSRLMVIAKEITTPASNRAKITIDSCGTEIVCRCAMYDTQNLEGWDGASDQNMNAAHYIHYTNAPFAGQDTATALLNYYNLHPCVLTTFADASDIYFSMYFDVDNYAIVSAHDVYKMHDTALLSLLDVPLLGSTK